MTSQVKCVRCGWHYYKGGACQVCVSKPKRVNNPTGKGGHARKDA